jgi:nonribosomal peptide synthetase DhbF
MSPNHAQLEAIGAAIRPVDRDFLERYFLNLGIDKVRSAAEISIETVLTHALG